MAAKKRKKSTTKKRTSKRSAGGIKISRFNIKKFTNVELKHARKNGYNTKKPKKPSGKNVKPETLTNYIDKYNNWVEQIKDNAKSHHQVMNLKGAIKTHCK